jgi:hypothetical protein
MKLKAIKISSMTYFGGEVKPSVPCRKTLLHIKEPYRHERDKYFILFYFTAISLQNSPASLSDASSGYSQRDLVDESGMIITQTGKA